MNRLKVLLVAISVPFPGVSIVLSSISMSALEAIGTIFGTSCIVLALYWLAGAQIALFHTRERLLDENEYTFKLALLIEGSWRISFSLLIIVFLATVFLTLLYDSMGVITSVYALGLGYFIMKEAKVKAHMNQEAYELINSIYT